MFGFFMTDTGIEKVAKATAQGEKVKINTLAVGDGGKPDEERVYERTALEHENYRKQMDDMDSYTIDRNNPNVVTIIAVVPDETGAITVNEVGFFDEEGDLIVYGVVEETSKGKGSNGSMQTIEITCYINFVNTGVENVEISVGSDGLLRLQLRVDALEERVTACETEEHSIREELKKFVLKEAGKGLSSKDFTQSYIDKIEKNIKDILSLSKLLSEKADTVSLNDYVRKENGKGLSTYDFTSTYRNQITTNKNDIASLTTKVNNKVDKVSGKGLSTYDFTSSYRNQIDTNESDIAKLKSRVSTLESSSGSGSSYTGPTTSEFNALKTRVTNLESSITDLSSIKSRLSSLESQLSGLATRMSNVATLLEGLR